MTQVEDKIAPFTNTSGWTGITEYYDDKGIQWHIEMRHDESEALFRSLNSDNFSWTRHGKMYLRYRPTTESAIKRVHQQFLDYCINNPYYIDS